MELFVFSLTSKDQVATLFMLPAIYELWMIVRNVTDFVTIGHARSTAYLIAVSSGSIIMPV
ncbi:hypothetical protein [Cohnella sp.]|uniref:hypothetical protein n=1 Tax=Cohnella sp. TaxID=1883426 RepID=UPI00356A8880